MMQKMDFDKQLEIILMRHPFSFLHVCWERYISKNDKYKDMRYYWGGWYHRDKKSSDPVYFIFRFELPGMGIGTVAHAMIFYYYWALRRGLIPIIDMEYRDIYDTGKMGINNVWEYCFEQVMPIEDVMKQKNVYISSVNPRLVDSKTCLKLNGNKKDAKIHYSSKREYYKAVNGVVRKYMILKPELRKDSENYIMNYLKGFKTLGVALREEFSLFPEGTSDSDLQLYKNHPNVPNVDDSIKIVQRYFEEWQCERIFLSTLYEDSIDKFTEVFGDKVVFLTRKRRKLGEEQEFVKKVWSNHGKNEVTSDYFKRENFYEQTYTYIEEMNILANCGSFIGAPSSVTSLALIINAGKYENVYFFEDKNHIAKID